MIEKMVDGDQLRQRADAADVIGVKVRDDEVVDFLQPGFGRHVVDALGVAVVFAPAGIHQQRLA